MADNNPKNPETTPLKDPIEEMRKRSTVNLPHLSEESKRRLRMTHRPLRINLFDIIIFVIIVAVGVAVYLFTNREAGAQTRLQRYTIELADLPEGFSEKIHEGDSISDNVKNYHMGKVVSVEAVPYKKLIEDLQDGKILDAAVPGRETVLITLEGNVTESDSEMRVEGSYLVRAGLEVAAKGPGYAGTGYILSVER